MVQALIAPIRRGYLNTALTGLPPPEVAQAARSVLDAWSQGRLDWTTAVDELDRARRAFARLVGVDASRVAVGHGVAGTLSAVAGNLPEGAVVLAPEGEHNSNLYPYLHQAPRGVRLEWAPLEGLAEAVRPHHAAVAFGLVQSADGRVADLPAIAAAARRVGALTLVDVTQACGWMPFDPGHCDVFVSAVYKWLMAPNGPAFLGLHPAVADRLAPMHRSWIGGVDVHKAPYGPEGLTATDARRFDLVPGFIAIAAATRALDLLMEVGLERIFAHNTSLVSRFCAALELPEHRSAIVAVPNVAMDPAGHGLAATRRQGGVRFAFHAYNDADDADAAAAFIRQARAG